MKENEALESIKDKQSKDVLEVMILEAAEDGFVDFANAAANKLAQLRARLKVAEKLAEAARNIPGAILAAKDAGCIDHLDAWDDADKLYRDKLFDLDAALQKWDALK